MEPAPHTLRPRCGAAKQSAAEAVLVQAARGVKHHPGSAGAHLGCKGQQLVMQRLQVALRRGGVGEGRGGPGCRPGSVTGCWLCGSGLARCCRWLWGCGRLAICPWLRLLLDQPCCLARLAFLSSGRRSGGLGNRPCCPCCRRSSICLGPLGLLAAGAVLSSHPIARACVDSGISRRLGLPLAAGVLCLRLGFH